MFSSIAACIALSVVGTNAIPLADLAFRDGIQASSFSVPAVHNVNITRNGTAALLKAYGKFNLQPTRDMPSQFGKRQNGVVVASPDSSYVEYLCPVTVGGQTLNLDFDSGSADLWVFSSLLASSSRTGHSYYTSSKSTTYVAKSGYTWDISYADGSGASGVVGTDTVTIGGTTVTKQAVELANKVSSAFVTDASDGLVGLSFSTINTVSPTQQKTFFDNAKASLASPLFAAYLPFQADGAYDFGYIDSTKYSGTVQYASVDSSNGFWEFASTSYKVGSTTYSSSGRTGIADTGTTLILMGDTAVDKYYASVSGATYSSADGGYVFPCTATLPSFSFRLGSTYYATIPASLMNFGAADSTGTTCYGSLQSVGSGTQNIYGDVFFNAYYGIFDASTPRFGFATAV